MATQEFGAAWVDVYNRQGGWSKKHSSHPIRTGGGSGTNWQSFIRIPDSVKAALRSSTTTPQLEMRINFTTAANEIDVGYHRESSSRNVGASGIPYYAYSETWRSIGTGWRSYGMSNWFMPNFLNGNVQGIVLYSFNGQFTNVADGVGVSNNVRFRVTGTWNTAPSTPTNVRVDKSTADVSQVARWNASTDAEQSQSELRYDVEFYNGSSWSKVSNKQSGLTHSRTTTKDKEVKNARFRVRAYDGELYSGWGTSPEFEIKHIPPTFSASGVSYSDRNPTTTNISGNNQHIIQNASLPTANVSTAARANDGKSISRYIFTLDGEERTRTSIGSVSFDTIDASYNQTLRVTAEDSAGMRTTVSVSVTVIAYKNPDVQYEATRQGSLSDTTVMKASGSISALSGKNSLQTTRYRYRRTNGSFGSWFTFNRSISGNSFTTTDVTLMLQNTNAWEIHIQVTDRLTTSDVYLIVGSGVPITFVDVDKHSFGVNTFPQFEDTFEVNGDIRVNGRFIITPFLGGSDKADPFIIQSSDPNGHGYIEYWGSDGKRKGYVGIGSARSNDFVVENEAGDISLRHSGRLKSWYDDIVGSGANNNGFWIRLYDGTMICWIENLALGFDNNRVLKRTWNLPAAFLGDPRPALFVTKNEAVSPNAIKGATVGGRVLQSGIEAEVLLMHETGMFSSGETVLVRCLAIGRWK